MSTDLFGTDSAGAIFDPERIYRYVLYRIWDPARPMMIVVMLNPSIADEYILDPTVKKCVEWAQRDGFGGLNVLNAFALRSTDPKLLYEHADAGGDPIGPENDRLIRQVVERYHDARIIIGWGRHGALLDRGAQMLRLLAGRELWCWGVNTDQSPSHPLYLRKSIFPVLYQGRL